LLCILLQWPLLSAAFQQSFTVSMQIGLQACEANRRGTYRKYSSRTTHSPTTTTPSYQSKPHLSRHRRALPGSNLPHLPYCSVSRSETQINEPAQATKPTSSLPVSKHHDTDPLPKYRPRSSHVKASTQSIGRSQHTQMPNSKISDLFINLILR